MNYSILFLYERSRKRIKQNLLCYLKYINLACSLSQENINGLASSQIGECLVTKDSDITRLAERLEKRGLIKKDRAEGDRRVMVSKITKKGLKILEELDEPVKSNNLNVLGHLGQDLLEQLNALLVLARNGN